LVFPDVGVIKEKDSGIIEHCVGVPVSDSESDHC